MSEEDEQWEGAISSKLKDSEEEEEFEGFQEGGYGLRYNLRKSEERIEITA